MLPDLRPRRDYRAPLPRWVLHVYVGLLIAFGATSLWLAASFQQAKAVEQTVAAKNQEMAVMKQRIESVNGTIDGLESSRIIKSDLDRWKQGSLDTELLQAAVIVSVADAEASLVESYRKAPTSTRRIGRVQFSNTRSAEEPRIQLKTLTAEVRQAQGTDAATVDLRIEIARNQGTDSRQLTQLLSRTLALMTPNGLRMTHSKPPEDRGASIVLQTTWKPASSQP